MIKVFNARNGKFAQAEQVDAETYTLIFTDGEQKEVKAVTFKKWYKEVSEEDFLKGQKAADDLKQAAKELDEVSNNAKTPEEGNTDTPAALADADAEAKKVAEAKKAEEVAAKEAAKAEKEAAKAAKKAEADAAKEAKKVEAEAKKAEAEQAKAAKKAEAEIEKVKKAEEAAAKKAAKEAEKAEKAANAAPRVAGEAGAKNKDFFTKFINVLKKESGEDFTKANARDRSYMSFPAGASGIKYKVVYSKGSLKVSLYIFGPQLVTTGLFNELLKYKSEVEEKLSKYNLEWDMKEDLKARRVTATLTGSDGELIANGIDTLIDFNTVFTPFVETITAA